MELLRTSASLTRQDGKTYRHHPFQVPEGVRALAIHFAYDRGGELPHSLVTLQIFDPAGCRGAAHRFAPRQTIEIGPAAATPGFEPGPITPGEWTIEIDVHCVIARADGRPNAYELTVTAQEAAISPAAALTSAAAPTPSPAPASAGPPRWRRGELHVHSEHSDGRWTLDDIAERAPARGIDFLFLTDHNTRSGVDLLRARLGSAVAVHPGIELTTYRGHALALGAERWLDWRTGLRGRTAKDMAREVRAAGAFFVVAHPDAPPDDVCTGCRWTYDDFDPGLADAVEVWGGLWDGPEERNQGCLDLWRAWLNQGRRLTATGATDAHRPEDWEGPVPLTYVHATDASLPSLLEALRAGRTYVSSGPFVEIRAWDPEASAEGATEGGVGDSVVRTPGLRLESRYAGAPAAELRLVANGKAIARERVRGDGRLTVPVGRGHTWCCAELWTADGSRLLAVTSPIYLL